MRKRDIEFHFYKNNKKILIVYKLFKDFIKNFTFLILFHLFLRIYIVIRCILSNKSLNYRSQRRDKYDITSLCS